MIGTKNGRMKNAAVVEPEAQPIEAGVSLHTKQLADKWGVESRSVTDWVARVQNLGYTIGTKGDRNRTYYNPDEQLLIQAARYQTLTPNPEQDDRYSQQQQDDFSRREDTAEQNANLQHRLDIVQQQGQTSIVRREAAYAEGSNLAKDELAHKLSGYLETRAAGEKVFDSLINELDSPTVQPSQPPIRRVGTVNPKRLEATLF